MILVLLLKYRPCTDIIEILPKSIENKIENIEI